MELGPGGSGSGNDGSNSNKGKGKRHCHRHSAEQIQQLEAFFKKCPHPDENQRRELGRNLGLDPKQIKFWFQNKRTQTKAMNSRADNHVLKADNEKLRCENIAMQESLKHVLCPECSGSNLSEDEKQLNLERLRMENARLKEEYERTMNHFSNTVGKSMMPPSGIEPFPSMAGNHFQGEGSGINPSLDPEQVPGTSMNPMVTYPATQIQMTDKSSIIKTAVAAMGELAELIRLNEPLWMKSRTEGRYTLNHDNYEKLFPKANHLKSASARTESSKASGEVAMAAIHLMDMFLDGTKWKNALPTIVTKAKTIAIIDTEGTGGSLHLMYEKMHILSPLVAPRELFFIRYCRQFNSNTWMMVDVSYDFMRELQDAAPTRSWKLPSGCMIEDLPDGKSFMTWVEHVQVDDKSSTHRLYRELICGHQSYGAKRWITSLQRACERFAFSMGLTLPTHELGGVIDSAEGRSNLMKVSHRVVQSFFELLSMSDKLDFPHLAEFNNTGVRVSMRKSSGTGQPDGFMVSAAASLWLPISYMNLFEFFKDEQKRAEWDVLANGNPVNTIAYVSTGTHPGNCISIVQPFITNENNMLVLQESSIDDLGAMIIYAPTDLKSIELIVSGGDPDSVPILPSGFVISPDGRADNGASSSSSQSRFNGSLLTVSFQILVCCNTVSKHLTMESVATVHTLISSTIQKIKTALNFSD